MAKHHMDKEGKNSVIKGVYGTYELVYTKKKKKKCFEIQEAKINWT